MARKVCLDLQSAMRIVRGQLFESREEYRAWHTANSKCKENYKFPLPYNPDTYYKDFPGWAVFFGTEFVTENELYNIVQLNEISTEEDYRAFAREYKRELRIPVFPEKHYTNKIRGLKFRGFRKLLYRESTCLSCASLWASSQTYKSKYAWKKAGRKKIPKSIFPYYRNESIDFKKFLNGGYYEGNCCSCKK